MMYPNLKFTKMNGRPFYYTNFVQTIDGKVQVVGDPKAYWPLGGKTDYQTLVELRAYADVLVHGKNTAAVFPILKNLAKSDFLKFRKQLKKNSSFVYTVVSGHPDKELIEALSARISWCKVILVTTKNAKVPPSKNIETVRIGDKKVDLKKLSELFYKNGYKNILVEGGPNLLGSFMEVGLIDEVFTTIAPKIWGNKDKKTLTMVEGFLFKPDDVKLFGLVSVKNVGDEVYLRYSVRN